jgi:hypothetical protein
MALPLEFWSQAWPLTRLWLPYHVQFSWQLGPGSLVVPKENKAVTLMVAASLPNGSPSCNLVGSMWMSTDCVSKTEENLPPSSLHVQTTITIIEVFAQSLARMSSVRSVALFSFLYKPARDSC